MVPTLVSQVLPRAWTLTVRTIASSHDLTQCCCKRRACRHMCYCSPACPSAVVPTGRLSRAGLHDLCATTDRGQHDRSHLVLSGAGFHHAEPAPAPLPSLPGNDEDDAPPPLPEDEEAPPLPEEPPPLPDEPPPEALPAGSPQGDGLPPLPFEEGDY